MAERCASCEQMYNTTDTCSGNEKPYKIGGTRYDTLPFKNFNRNARCPECGVKAGGKHHYGCEEEICPACKGRVTLCDCPYDVKDIDPETETEEEVEQL